MRGLIIRTRQGALLEHLKPSASVVRQFHHSIGTRRSPIHSRRLNSNSKRLYRSNDHQFTSQFEPRDTKFEIGTPGREPESEPQHQQSDEKLIRINPSMSDYEVEKVYTKFVLATDSSSGALNYRNVDEAIGIWSEAFSVNDSKSQQVISLQQKLISKRKRLITTLMNHKKYDLYVKKVEDLYKNHPSFAKLDPGWTERVFSIIKFQDGDFDIPSIHSYISNESVGIDKRRDLITTFLRKGLYYSEERSVMLRNELNENEYRYIKAFFEFASIVEEGLDNFSNGISSYQRAINVIIGIPNISSTLKSIIVGLGSDESHELVRNHKLVNREQTYLTMLSLLLKCSADHNQSKIALSIWKDKISYHKRTTTHLHTISLTPDDLTNIMQATFDAGLYAKTVELYKEWQYLLKDDLQISILLKLAGKERDWRSLQKQFEDMYGKGTLPHKVHYGIVMNALASIGARDEVKTLFNQLLRRNFVPDTSVIAALVNSSMYHGEFDTAQRIIEKYGSGKGISSDYLYQTIFDLFHRSNDLKNAIKWFHIVVKEQKESKTARLLNSNSITSLTKVCQKNYAIKELDMILRTINTDEQFNYLIQMKTYVDFMKAYTKLSLYEEAENLSFMAFDILTHPHNCGSLFTAKMSNYRRWLQSSRYSTVHEKELLHSQIRTIINSHLTSKVIPTAEWFMELINYYIYVDNNLDRAEQVLEFLKKSNLQLLNERHYHPIMKYHVLNGQHNNVLELFKDMTSNDVSVSIMSHFWLMRALTHLDKTKRTDFTNSTNLLKAVYDINGLTLDTSTIGSSAPPASATSSDVVYNQRQVPKGELYQNVEVLANITMIYILEKNDPTGNNLLFHFLEQVRERTSERVTNTFKYPLYKNIFKYYKKLGNHIQAESIAQNILQDLKSTIDTYIIDLKEVNQGKQVSVPTNLELGYQYYLGTKLKDYEIVRPYNIDNESFFRDIVDLVEPMKNGEIKLNIFVYNKLVQLLVSIPPQHSEISKNGFLRALGICEDYLTTQNWRLVATEKAKQYILKALMVFMNHSISKQVLQEKYSIVLDFYMIKLDDLLAQYQSQQLVNSKAFLQKAINSFSKKFSENNPLTIDTLLKRDLEFFKPPNPMKNHLVIQNHNVNLLLSRLKHFMFVESGGSKEEWFKLMDEYPLTIEFLLMAEARHLRYSKFMWAIDKLEPAPVSELQESFESKQERIFRALRKIQEDNQHVTAHYIS
ncbi:putative mitochondrial group I intron splicing factor CCM1 [[Candida] railenensis]|uniref:Mitochondrial group I intron splicing factor CCM1 n=1 Tax=[Candida] railenensis TaxID=45579 RepID=A0A9P0VYY7_9ASCO|nr:putative mitochondrial group I intron splicing factor CCM1 [[Candida] railenensis]